MKHIQLYLLAFAILVLNACSILKPSTPAPTTTKKEEPKKEEAGVLVYNPKTGKYEKVPSGTTTNPPKETNKPTNPSGNPTSNPANKPKEETEVIIPSYRMTYILPFFSDKFTADAMQVPDKSRWALQFYSGVKLALDSIAKAKNIKLTVDVLDSKASETEMMGILGRTALRNADVIIGGETNKNVELLANFSKTNEKVFISPYNPSPDIVKNNAYLLQAVPSLQMMAYKVMQHAKKVAKPSQIILISKNKANESAILENFQTAHFMTEGSTTAPRLKQIVLDETDNAFVKTDFKPYFQTGTTTAFIIPSWTNETFIYALLRKIDQSRVKGQNVVVYGMPQWMNFDTPIFELYKALNLRVPVSNYIDKDTPSAKAFIRDFYSLTAIAPRDEAFLGYDLTLYTAEMLRKSGRAFQSQAELTNWHGLIHSMQYQRMVSNPTAELQNSIDRFENNGVNILKFENYYFTLD